MAESKRTPPTLSLTATFLPTETVTKRLTQDLAEAFVALRDNVFDNSPLLLEAFERADEAIARLLATVEDGEPTGEVIGRSDEGVPRSSHFESTGWKS